MGMSLKKQGTSLEIYNFLFQHNHEFTGSSGRQRLDPAAAVARSAAAPVVAFVAAFAAGFGAAVAADRRRLVLAVGQLAAGAFHFGAPSFGP